MNHERLKTKIAGRAKLLEQHVILTACEAPGVAVYRLVHPGQGRIMSVQLAFTPEGISIMGDYCPGGKNGVNSNLGYGLGWFAGRLGPDYLAQKFLQTGWTKDDARDHIENWIANTVERLADLADDEDGDCDAEHERLSTCLVNMRAALSDAGDGELADATAYDHHFAHLFPKDSDTETVYPDGDYNEDEAADLAAIQQAFARLWAARPVEDNP